MQSIQYEEWTMTENTDVNANFLDADWWKTATIEDVKAEMAKGADVNAQRNIIINVSGIMIKDDPELVGELNKFGVEIDYDQNVIIVDPTENDTGFIMNELYFWIDDYGGEMDSNEYPGWTPLMFAASYNKNPDIIRGLIELGANINASIFNMTALSCAAYKNENPEIIRTLVELGADINAGDYDTPLMLAAQCNKNPEIIRTLVELGADVKDTTQYNENPKIISNVDELFDITHTYTWVEVLMCAARDNENPEIIRTIFELGGDINTKILSKALICAARDNENPEIVNALINLGADVNMKDNEGKTALMHAVSNNVNTEVVRTLAKQGMISKEDINTALILSSEYNQNPEIVRTLVELGADVNLPKRMDVKISSKAPKSIKDDMEFIYTYTPIEFANYTPVKDEPFNEIDMTALQIAAISNKNPEVIRTLVELGANIEAKIDILEQTVLMMAAHENNNPEIIRALVELGADIDAVDCRGATAFMAASNFNKNPEIIRMLFELGSKVNAKDNEGRTSLMWAAWSNENPEIIRTLVKMGNDINAQDNVGRTPLMYASYYNTETEIIRTLVEFGANVNTRDNKGWTALIYAIKHSPLPPIYISFHIGSRTEEAIVHTLLELGANINAKDNEGKTAIDYAKENKNPEILKLLEEYSKK